MASSITLKVGGALGVVGGLAYFAILLLHGDLPDQTTEVALDHIADRAEWRALKLGLIASTLCWLGAFSALGRSIQSEPGRLLAQWALLLATIGVAVVVVEYAIIGHAMKDTADAWLIGTEEVRSTAVQQGDIMLSVSAGLFHSYVAWLIGMPFVLYGIAIACERDYPLWLGAVAVFAGAGALLSGTSRFLGFELVPYPILYGGFVIPLSLWVAVTGFFMWRLGWRSTAGADV